MDEFKANNLYQCINYSAISMLSVDTFLVDDHYDIVARARPHTYTHAIIEHFSKPRWME